MDAILESLFGLFVILMNLVVRILIFTAHLLAIALVLVIGSPIIIYRSFHSEEGFWIAFRKGFYDMLGWLPF